MILLQIFSLGGIRTVLVLPPHLVLSLSCLWTFSDRGQNYTSQCVQPQQDLAFPGSKAYDPQADLLRKISVPCNNLCNNNGSTHHQCATISMSINQKLLPPEDDMNLSQSGHSVGDGGMQKR